MTDSLTDLPDPIIEMLCHLNKLTKLGRCDRETIELANNSNASIVRTVGKAS